MRPLKNIEKLINKLEVKPRAHASKRNLEDALTAHKKSIRSAHIKPTIGRIIMKNPITKFAAAVLILVVLLLCFWPHSVPNINSQLGVVIPPELASITAQQLMKLYYDSSQTAYTQEILKAALQKVLEKTDPKDVIEIAENIAGQSQAMGRAGGLGPAPIHPLNILGYTSQTFPEVVEESNLMVHARLLTVDISIDDFSQALLDIARRLSPDDLSARYRTTVQFQVMDVLPENALEKDQIITAPAVMNKIQFNRIKEGQEYFMAMKQDNEKGLKFLDGFTGIYPVDYNNPVTSDFWLFFADAQDVLLFGNEPSQETIDYWASKLDSDSDQLAVEYMNIIGSNFDSEKYIFRFDYIKSLVRRYTIDNTIDKDNSTYYSSSTSEAFNLEALYTAGQQEEAFYEALKVVKYSAQRQQKEAINAALKVLTKPIRVGAWLDLYEDASRYADMLLFLGTTQREDLLSIIELYTTDDYFDSYKYKSILFQSNMVSYLSSIQQNAILAMTRLGGTSVNPKLHEIYQSTNDIRVKTIAAIALYYNGDTTGEELVRQFVEGTMEDTRIRTLKIAKKISSYLRNDLTDALLLEKLTYYIDEGDLDILGTDFFKDYRHEILSIAVDQLNNKDRDTRGCAIIILRNATGQNFGFQFDRYAGQQDDIIQRWRDYIKASETTQ